jgi:hypothetical protein
MHNISRYWLFATMCLALAGLLVRLVLRERVTLQASLWYLIGLAALTAFALIPGASAWVATEMGFALPSNFLFAVSIAVLALLYVTALVTLSRVELRSIVLTQELALLKEKLDRLERPQGRAGRA